MSKPTLKNLTEIKINDSWIDINVGIENKYFVVQKNSKKIFKNN
jgi:hypothetical protein